MVSEFPQTHQNLLQSTGPPLPPLRSWQYRQDGPWIRLSTQFRGPDVCLDVDPASNQPELRGCGAFTGQRWQLARTNKGVQ